MKNPILILATLNLFDLISTFMSLQTGFATELNPLMAWAYEASPWFFVFLKLFLTVVALYAAWFVRGLKATGYAVNFLLFVYTALFGWHMAMWSLYWR